MVGSISIVSFIGDDSYRNDLFPPERRFRN